ncbi:MAG: hypothetical protein IJ481_02125, partial [Alphaproteobacteria bacterium]|nr:hypothetical protein [Alphaproteobacteria bacterium]
FIDIYSSNTLTNTGTIDISNITDLSNWYNDNIFTLEGGSTFILPKSILGDRKKIGYFYRFKPITLSGTKDKPVNIVIPKDCEYITYIDNNNKEDLFDAIQEATGFKFNGKRKNVRFSWQPEEITVSDPITIGSSTKDTKVATDLENKTDYNYWSTEEDKTYVFNSNRGKHEIAKNTVTIDEDYTLKLITTGYTSNPIVLYCLNTFTNNGNVTIDNYGELGLNKKCTSNNNGTIDINKGKLGLYDNATLNNNTNGTITLKGSSHIYTYTDGTLTNKGTIILKDYSCIYIRNSAINNTGTITFKDSSCIDIYSYSTLNNTGTIRLTDSRYIHISDSTLSNKGTIDISNITNLSYWFNYGKFTLEEGSTFILPKSITKKINTYYWKKPITLNGTDNKPVNIVIPKDCEYIKNIDNNNKYALFKLIKEETGFTFNGKKGSVKFSWQTEDHINQPIEARQDNEYESVDEC